MASVALVARSAINAANELLGRIQVLDGQPWRTVYPPNGQVKSAGRMSTPAVMVTVRVSSDNRSRFLCVVKSSALSRGVSDPRFGGWDTDLMLPTKDSANVPVVSGGHPFVFTLCWGHYSCSRPDRPPPSKPRAPPNAALSPSPGTSRRSCFAIALRAIGLPKRLRSIS